ncbi:MAG: NAD(P)-binding domain-containing protein [Myxococcaceae bacterium]|jgi:predicted dinucleotide-binding enzyme|nr:NAD(P)-binding domain-containing protein [Myxococcaceae bacterium]MCA3013958.1 NAD(P)-binding domain-containing protein [Myxococcaceae bacterium]
MHIGIIGAGKVGSTLGAAFTKAGQAVTMGVRSPGETPGAVSVAEAVAAAEVVVLATPFAAVEHVVDAAGPMAGKVVVDATNPLLPSLALAVGHSDSGGEVLQRLVPRARVVKCFNTVGVEVMANPTVGGRQATMFLCGDDAGARQTVLGLARALGFDAVELGPLKHARLLEPAAALWIQLAMVERRGRRIALRLEGAGAQAKVVTPSTPSRRVAVLGAGHIGGGLARAWAKAGHAVTVGVRAPTAADSRGLASETGARVTTPAEAVAASDVVALAVPAQGVEALATEVRFGGKLVIDCTNHVGPGFTLSFGHTTSWAEEVARRLPGARVFKSFNAQGAENVAQPLSVSGPSANFFCGDDAAGREVVSQLVQDVGFEPVSVGALRQARLLEPLMMLWVTAARVMGQRAMGFRLLRD